MNQQSFQYISRDSYHSAHSRPIDSHPLRQRNVSFDQHDYSLIKPQNIETCPKTINDLSDATTMNGYYTEVFSWGSDQNGQLGLGMPNNGKPYTIPRYCTYNIAIKMVACGDEHSAFITSKLILGLKMIASNLIYTMGDNSHGQLGINDKRAKSKNSPVLVENLMDKKPAYIACGAYHTVIATCTKSFLNFLIEDGEVYSWGSGKHGQLGVFSNNDQYAPVYVRFNEARNTQITQLSCGSQHTIFLDATGRAFVCGSNSEGELGLGTRDKESEPVLMKKFTEKLKAVAAGHLHTLLLTQSGHVYVCGDNSSAQLGLNHKRSVTTPQLISEISHIPMRTISAGSFSASISEAGDLYLWGTGVFGEFLTPHRVKTIQGTCIDVSVGNNFGAAVNRDGYIYTWGINNNGEIGQGDLDERGTPQVIKALNDRVVSEVACGKNFVLALGQTLKHGESGIKIRQPQVEQSPYQDRSRMQMDRLSTSSENRSGSKIKSKIKSSSKKSASAYSTASTKMYSTKSRHQHQNSKDYTPLRNSPQRIKPQQTSPQRQKLHASPQRAKSQLNKCDNHCNRCQYHSHQHVHITTEDTTKKSTHVRQKSKLKTKRDQEQKQQEQYVVDTPLIAELKAQVARQQDLTQQYLDRIDRDRETMQMLRSDKQLAEDALWREKNLKKSLEQEVTDLKLQLKDSLAQNSELKNHSLLLAKYQQELDRLQHLDQDYQYSQSQVETLQNQLNLLQAQLKDKEYAEQQRLSHVQQQETQQQQRLQQTNVEIMNENSRLKGKITDLERELQEKTRLMRDNERQIMSYGDSLKGLEEQFVKNEREMEDLRQQNRMLKEQLDRERDNSMQYHHLNIALEEQANRKQQADTEVQHLRQQLSNIEADKSMEVSNLKRALDDLRYQHEDSMRVIAVKNEEIRHLQNDMSGMREMHAKLERDIEHYQNIIADLEDKNRKLNEKLNEVIYNKASAYKQRTLQALRMGSSPERKERAHEYGIPNVSEQRLEQVIQDERMTTDKALSEMKRLMIRQHSPSPNKSADPSTQYDIYKELDRMQNNFQSKDISPYEQTLTNCLERDTLRREDLSATKQQNTTFNLKPISHQRTNSSYAQTNSSPLRSQALQNHSPIKEFNNGYQHQNQVKHQCDRLASVLGISENQYAQSTQYQSDMQNMSMHKEEPMIANQAATIMTSSLSDLRKKLDTMKRDKELVESGISDFEARASN